MEYFGDIMREDISKCSFCSSKSTHFIFFHSPYRSYPLCDDHTAFFRDDLGWIVKEMKDWESNRSAIGRDYPLVLENLQRLVEREDREGKRETLCWLVCCLEEIKRNKILEFDTRYIAQRWNIVEIS
jgi:hypothetical protein